MGGIGIAVNDSRHPSIKNPAALFFLDQDSSFVLDSSYADFFKPNSGETFPSYPCHGLKGTFIGKMLAFSIGFDYSVEDVNTATVSTENGIKYYNIYQNSEIRLDFSAGLGNFAAGIEVFGGSSKQRINIPVHNSTAFSDFFIQTFLAQYDRSSNSEYIQINLGFMYKTGDFTFGLMFDDILEAQGLKTSLSWDSFISDTGIGVYYVRSEYGKRGKLNTFGLSAGLEITSLFTEDKKTLHAGLELSYMLLKDYGFYFRTGYEALLDSFDNGTHSFGVGAKFDKLELYLNFNFPLLIYKGLNSTLNTNDRFSVELAMTFAF